MHCVSRWIAPCACLPLAASQAAGAGANGSAYVPRADLCVTEGRIDAAADGRMTVDTPKMRAYLNRTPADAIELQFTYRGATTTQSALGSGAVRQQFGLKLRAGDACNLVYMMWRVQPQSKLVASVKSNAGEHTSAACANRGYQNLKAAFSAPVPPLEPGSAHRLRAEIHGDQLQAFVDGSLAWRGLLGSGAALAGPAGLRTDNVRLEFALPVQGASESGSRGSCVGSSGDAD